MLVMTHDEYEVTLHDNLTFARELRAGDGGTAPGPVRGRGSFSVSTRDAVRVDSEQAGRGATCKCWPCRLAASVELFLFKTAPAEAFTTA